MENVIDNPRGRIAVGIFFPFSRFIFHFFLYLCRVVRSEAGRVEGGRQTYIKGVESTSYLRRSELRNF